MADVIEIGIELGGWRQSKYFLSLVLLGLQRQSQDLARLSEFILQNVSAVQIQLWSAQA